MRDSVNFFRGGVLLLMAALLGGCGGADYDFEYDGAYDPLESINRPIYKFNKFLDYVTLRPLALIYDTVTPNVVQSGVDNVLNNLGEPRNMVNHLLQSRVREAAGSTARLIINSSLGVGGIFDVAEKWEIAESKNDFGITFRAYITNDGMVLMLPLLGPSSITDLPGQAADWFTDPLYLADAEEIVQQSVGGLQIVHTRAGFLEQEDLLETALDEYVYVRDFREEYRRQQVPGAEKLWFHPYWKR